MLRLPLFWVKAGVGAGISAILLAVFALYMRPQFLVTLADQLWSCF